MNKYGKGRSMLIIGYLISLVWLFGFCNNSPEYTMLFVILLFSALLNFIPFKNNRSELYDMQLFILGTIILSILFLHFGVTVIHPSAFAAGVTYFAKFDLVVFIGTIISFFSLIYIKRKG